MRLIALSSMAVFATCFASAEGPVFDAASVRLTGPEIQQPYTITGGPGTSDPGHFRAPRISLIFLLSRAFSVGIDQITGPAWLRDVASANNYTVVATMPPDTTKEQFQKMLQNLLVERFHLLFHPETRSFPGYQLVIDKGGPKFKEVVPTQATDGEHAASLHVLSGGRGADDFPNFPGPRTISLNGRGGQVRTKYQERTMAEFVSNLGFVIGSSQGKGVLQGVPQPRVVDKTGLAGKYTFVLEYYDAGSESTMASLPRLGANSDNGNAAPPVASDPDGSFPDIFVAIRKQLGLRLDKTPDVPLDMIAVESVDKVPTEN